MSKDTCHAIFLKLNKAERFEVIEMLVKKINTFDEVEIIVDALDLHIGRPTTNTADIFDEDEFHDSVEDADTDEEMATVKFVPDDLVLVDFPECGYWPCRITGVLNKDWRKVEYFGGRQIGKAHVKVILEYDEDAKNHLKRYIPERKRKKNPMLKLAVKQINEKFIRARSLAMKTGDGTEEIGVSNKKKRSGVTPGRGPQRSIAPPPAHIPVDQFDTSPQLALPPKKGTPTGYCDFCLGGLDPKEKSDDGKVLNRDSNLAEVLIVCAACGHSGHPGCLQFTVNRLASVSGYPWQCMECKTCTVCSTGENDKQMLFCDGCDRGYHMYCIVPPIKEAPEGTWSCVSCVDKFHKD